MLSRILFSLEEDWGMDEQGLESALADRMAQTMEPAISAYIEACAAHDLSPEEEALRLNELVRSYLRWRSR